jgi:hypothetical protein
MLGDFGPSRQCAALEAGDFVVAAADSVGNRSDCLIQLLGAFHDIADFDDIHQAADRLNAVQAWIRREARHAAAMLADDADAALEISEVA